MADDTATDADGDDDERQIELDSITAIFPEIVLDPAERFVASIDIPVVPLNPVPVTFPASSDGATLDSIINADHPAELPVETHNLSYLPSLHLEIILPEGYPSDNAPSFQLSTNPAWLSQDILIRLQNDGGRLWEEFGHDQVLYAYIDHLQQAAENAFGVLDHSPYLEVLQDHKISLLDFDIKAKRAAFEAETFDCGICLDPKKGLVCHRMLDCSHVFCRQCLQDFYTNAITEGDLATVRCLAPDCAKNRAAAASTSGNRKKTKTNISPSELLQIPLDTSLVRRYVRLKHKAEIESDKNTVYCPRKWCQGAARSKKHRKPSQDFEKMESSDEESEDDAALASNTSKFKDDSRDQLLSICEDCSFAFCSRCFQGWHGVDKSNCIPRKTTGELTEEDKASMHYLQMHSTPCPTCNARAQKTHGCNHMICFKCDTHFCYLCSSWLSPGNPYNHFNNESTGCYQRLWALEEGDGDGVDRAQRPRGDEPVDNDPPVMDDDIAAQMDRMWAAVFGIRPERIGLREFLEEHPGPNQRRPAAEPVEVAREGPLVLRLAVPPQPQVPDPPPAAPAGRVLGQRIVVGNRAARENPAPRRQQHQGNIPLAPLPPGPDARPRQVPNDAAPNRPRWIGEGNFLRNLAARENQAPRRQQHRGNLPLPPLPPGPDGRPRQVPNDAVPEQAGFENQRAWIQQFVQLALRDEEDQMDWDSDDEEDGVHDAFEIPMRE